MNNAKKIIEDKMRNFLAYVWCQKLLLVLWWNWPQRFLFFVMETKLWKRCLKTAYKYLRLRKKEDWRICFLWNKNPMHWCSLKNLKSLKKVCPRERSELGAIQFTYCAQWKWTSVFPEYGGDSGPGKVTIVIYSDSSTTFSLKCQTPSFDNERSVIKCILSKEHGRRERNNTNVSDSENQAWINSI